MKNRYLTSTLCAVPFLFAISTTVQAKSAVMDYSSIFNQAAAPIKSDYQKSYSEMSDSFKATNATQYAQIKTLRASRTNASASAKLAAANKIDVLINTLKAQWADKVSSLQSTYNAKYKALRTQILNAANKAANGEDIFIPGSLLNGKNITSDVKKTLGLTQ